MVNGEDHRGAAPFPDPPLASLDGDVVAALQGADDDPARRMTWEQIVDMQAQRDNATGQAGPPADLPGRLSDLQDCLLVLAAKGNGDCAGACKRLLGKRLVERHLSGLARHLAGKDRSRRVEAVELCNEFFANKFDHLIQRFDATRGVPSAYFRVSFERFAIDLLRKGVSAIRTVPLDEYTAPAPEDSREKEDEEFREAALAAVREVLAQLAREGYPQRRLESFRLRKMAGLTLERTAKALRDDGTHPKATTNTVHQDANKTLELIRDRMKRGYPGLAHFFADEPEVNHG